MRLYDCADIIRSKNAGPFTLTIDLFFGDDARYDLARRSALLTPAGVARAYGVSEDRVVGVFWDDRIRAAKVSLARWSTCNDALCPDLFGAHLHTPLASSDLDADPQNGDTA